MQVFTDWIKKTPHELITEAEEEIKSGLLARQRSIKKYIVGFRKYLQDKGLAEYTVKSYLTGVKIFYNTFDIEIPKLPRAGNRARARPLEKHNGNSN
jgi:hypothetical protein